MLLKNSFQNQPVSTKVSPKKNSNLVIIIISLIVLVGGYLGYTLYISSKAEEINTKSENKISQEIVSISDTSDPKPDNNVSNPNNQTTYTISQVAEKNTRSSCWTIIEDKVYDITNYIPNHPGGEKEILQICGKDGSKLFAQPQEHKEGEANKSLAKLYLGNLAQ